MQTLLSRVSARSSDEGTGFGFLVLTDVNRSKETLIRNRSQELRRGVSPVEEAVSNGLIVGTNRVIELVSRPHEDRTVQTVKVF